jgi:hypothetical protein
VRARVATLCKVAAALALLGLALVTWSVVSPRPVPVLLAMTLGQLVGGTSLLLFAIAVLADLQVDRALRAGQQSERS